MRQRTCSGVSNEESTVDRWLTLVVSTFEEQKIRHESPGAPSFAFFAKGGIRRVLRARFYPCEWFGGEISDRANVDPTLRQRREGWGTRNLLAQESLAVCAAGEQC
jgi:hypothetical protein